MKSPFPGMDPYLERHWLDVHQRMCTYSCDALSDQLGAGLRARMGERLIIEREEDASREMYPDVRVFQHGDSDRPIVPQADAAVAVAEPLIISAEPTEYRQPFVQIIDLRSGGRVITVIEFMSPTNKLPGDGRDKYLAKMDECKRADVSVVEIDLTRGGRRQVLCLERRIPASHRTLFMTSVWRNKDKGFGRFEIYRMPLQERLPAIRIPLRREDPDAVLDLQALIDQAYAKGQYDDIDYTEPAIPPLEGEDATWADELLKAAGKRLKN